MPALLALFLRSLRLHLRALRTALVHAALVGVILLFLFGSHASATAVGAPGLDFFRTVMVLNLAALTLAAITYFASAITEEKEEGTLGLLQMTNLDPLAILLGKSTTRLCGALLLLLVQLPFTLLAVTLGGISAHQIFAAYATLGAYTFFLCNLALLASVLAPRTSIASIFTGGFLLLAPAIAAAMLAAPTLASLPHFRGKADAAAEQLAGWGVSFREASPFHRLSEITATGFNATIFGWQFWSNALGGVLCFALAWALFDLATGERRLFASGRIVPRGGTRFGRFAPERPWTISPIAWKDFHFLHGGRLAMLGKFTIYGLVCAWQIWLAARDYPPQAPGVTDWSKVAEAIGSASTGIVSWLFLALTVEVGLIASRLFREEVRNKTITGLATLPFAMKHIVMMKMDGAKRALAPVLYGLALGSAGVLGAAMISPGNSAFGKVAGIFGLLYVWVQVWLFAHLTAYFSVRLRWGALPLSFGICFIGNFIGLILCFGIFVGPILALILVPTFRESINARLELLAAED